VTGNTRNYLDGKIQEKSETKLIMMSLSMLNQLTGEQKELLLMLKIKDNVAHAGLSPQLVQLKVLILLQERPMLYNHSQNNNLSLATNFLIVDVMEDQWILHLCGLKATHSCSRRLILTLQERLKKMENALTKNQRERAQLKIIKMSNQRIKTN
jgi:hypothetical protein